MCNQALIECRNLSFEYEQEQAHLSQPLFQNINLSIYPKDTIILTGASGSGKTTLLHILGKLIIPSKGDVFVNASKGFVFQSPNLISTLTAQENIAINAAINLKAHNYNARETWYASMRKAYNLLGALEPCAHQFPNELSGGQAQRIAILRAMSANPRILLCDEPTGNLDEESCYKILDLLLKYVENNNAALFVISHNLEIAHKFKKHYKLYQGNLMQLK